MDSKYEIHYNTGASTQEVKLVENIMTPDL